MTSNDLPIHETITESTVKRKSNRQNKNIPKAGSVHDNIEINDQYLDEILRKNNS